MRKFAISDIHGNNKTFRTLLFDIIKLKEEDELYLLGDYIDRGPDSKGVIDTIFELQENGYSVFCLKGNHEDLLLKHNIPKFNDIWMKNGGPQTLRSFKVQRVEHISKKYMDFFNELEYYFVVDEYILVHAGLNFLMPDPFMSKYDLLWIRHWHHNINKKYLGEKYIIHGHTPNKKNQIEKALANFDETRWLDIDNGSFNQLLPGELGNLCAFDMTNRKLYFQKNIDIE